MAFIPIKGVKIQTGIGMFGNQHVRIYGLEDLMQKIRTLQTSGQRSAITSAVKAGMTKMAAQMRKTVSATPCDTAHAASLKAGMRKLIGARFNRGGVDKAGKNHVMVAKVGFAVGKKPDGRLSRGETATNKRRVGVTKQTAHWFVLGTPNREHSQISPIFKDVVPKSLASGGEAAMQAAVKKAKQRFEKIAAKKLKAK
jgi:hypothetical protein